MIGLGAEKRLTFAIGSGREAGRANAPISFYSYTHRASARLTVQFAASGREISVVSDSPPSRKPRLSVSGNRACRFLRNRAYIITRREDETEGRRSMTTCVVVNVGGRALRKKTIYLIKRIHTKPHQIPRKSRLFHPRT